jgi:tetratricopeptide (TPR) repeat protein
MSIFLGVDLGHHSIVTASSSTDEPLAVTVDANGLSNRSTPSIIGIESNRVIFGEEAETRLSSVPGKFVHSFPGKMNTDSEHGPFEDDLLLDSSHLLSLFFKNYIDQVHAGKNLECVTVAVPVGFSDAQVQVVADAAHLCGITNIDIIDHMDAALTLLSKDISLVKDTSVLVVDCGYAQTSIGLVTKDSPVITSKQGIGFGVVDMMEMICNTFMFEKNQDFFATIKKSDPKLFFRLLKVCEKALKDLSMLPSTVVDLSDYEEALTERHALKISKWSIPITRESFEESLRQNDHFAQLELKLKELKSVIGGNIRVEMVGGGSRVPFISKTVASILGVDQVGRSMDGSAFAALGAALWSTGRRLWPNSSRLRDEHSMESRRNSLTEAFRVQESVQRIHDLEVMKLRRKNELEAYLYQVKYWLSDEPKAKGLLRPEIIEPQTDKVWEWFNAIDDGDQQVAPDGKEYEEKLTEIKKFIEEEGAEFFSLLAHEKQKKDDSLTANAEYLSASSAHETAAEKRAKHTPTSNEQCIKLAGKNKEEGNELFKHGTVTDAMNRYMRAINLLAQANKATMTNEEKVQTDAILLSTNLNMAQCVVRLTAAGNLSQEERDGLLKRGIACADAALAIEPSNPKAKYRKAVCLDRLKETEQAKKIVGEALRQNPEDSDLKALYDSLVASLKDQQSKAKKFFSKMFQ